MVSHNFLRYENNCTSRDRPLDFEQCDFERWSSDRHSFITSLLVRVSAIHSLAGWPKREKALPLVPGTVFDFVLYLIWKKSWRLLNSATKIPMCIAEVRFGVTIIRRFGHRQ
jgi:hypothetical protein